MYKDVFQKPYLTTHKHLNWVGEHDNECIANACHVDQGIVNAVVLKQITLMNKTTSQEEEQLQPKPCTERLSKCTQPTWVRHAHGQHFSAWSFFKDTKQMPSFTTTTHWPDSHAIYSTDNRSHTLYSKQLALWVLNEWPELKPTALLFLLPSKMSKKKM